MRGPDLVRPFRGVRVAAPAEPAISRSREQDLRDRCDALLLLTPPGSFLSHLTAARLWPLPLPSLDPDAPLHVSVRAPERAPRRTGVIGHQAADPATRVVVRHGLPLVDPATLFCQLAALLPRPDLIAVGDALVLQPVVPDPWDERPWVPLRQLTERVEHFRGRGKQAAAEAVQRIRPGAESRPETLLRLAIVSAGLPEPAVNVDIFGARGRFLGRADLVYRKWRVIVEYDGDHHRTSTRQFDKDVLRLEGFSDAGWKVIRIVGRSFFGDQASCLQRVRRALTEAGWRA
ncbi:MAG: DUF559 domain-containing protein [Nakamurella sp.]